MTWYATLGEIRLEHLHLTRLVQWFGVSASIMAKEGNL